MKEPANIGTWGALEENWDWNEAASDHFFFGNIPMDQKCCPARREGPSATETLVPPRRDERPHQTERGRNNTFSLPGQEAYIAWTRWPPFAPLRLDLFNPLLKKIELSSRLFFPGSHLPFFGYQPRWVSQRQNEFSQRKAKGWTHSCPALENTRCCMQSLVPRF